MISKNKTINPNAKLNSGFSVIILILLTVCIVIGGFVTWYYHSKNLIKDNSTSSSVLNSDSEQTNKPLYLDIPELNLRLTLTEEIRDTIYITDTTSVSGITFVRFTSIGLQAMEVVNSQCSAASSSLGVLWRVGEDPVSTGAHATTIKQLGLDYILYNRPQQSCSTNIATQELQSKQAKILESAISSIANIE